MGEEQREESAPPLTRRERRLRAERSVPRILTVCTGNICRSPLAETILRSRLRDLGVEVSSAGTQAVIGHEMTRQAQELAVRRGADAVEAADHRARFLIDPMLLEADLVLAMSREHRDEAVQLTPSRLHNVMTVRQFGRIAAEIDDDAIRAAADAGGDLPAQRFSSAVQAVAAHSVGPGAVDDDVIDPYHRSDAVYEESATQMDAGLVQVERVARLALS